MSARYKIDSVSNMYPALGGLVYRICAVFKEPVEVETLRSALKGLAPRFPIMCSHLEKTFWGYDHVPATDYDVIDLGEPMFVMPEMYDTEKPSVRLHVRGNRVAMDVFHGNGDGCACGMFFSALAADYIRLHRGQAKIDAPKPAPEDLEDPYVRYYQRSKMAGLLEKSSYKLQLPYPKAYDYARFSCISVDLKEAKAFGKPKGLSVNDLINAAVALAIYKTTDAKESDLPVTLAMPIDLRRQYGSKSQRNFVFFTNLRATKEQAVDLETMGTYLHGLAKAATTPEKLRRGVSVVYHAANTPVVKYTPRSLREWVFRIGYRAVQNNSITTTVSNVGYQTLPEDVRDGFERFELYLGPGKGSINVSAIGYGDAVSLCITSGSSETQIEDSVQAILLENGIHSSRTSFAYRDGVLQDNA